MRRFSNHKIEFVIFFTKSDLNVWEGQFETVDGLLLADLRGRDFDAIIPPNGPGRSAGCQWNSR